MQRDVYIVRLTLVGLPFLIGIGLLTAHLHQLQVVRHEELLKKASNRYTTSRTERSGRGEIRDLHGIPLAGNLACRDIFAEPWRFEDRRNAILTTVSRELDTPRAELEALCIRACSPEDRYPRIPLRRAVAPTLARQLNDAGLRGVVVKEASGGPGGGGFRQRLKRIVRPRLPDQQTAFDVFLETRELRAKSTRQRVFTNLAPLLGTSAGRLSTLFDEATRQRTRPVEVVFARSVPVQKAWRIQAYRQLRLNTELETGKRSHALDILARELDVPPTALTALYQKKTQESDSMWITIAEAVPGETTERITGYHLDGVRAKPFLRGLRFADTSRRYYTKGRMLANVIGFTNAANKGVTGIEQQYDDMLRPQFGTSSYIRDRTGQRLESELADHRPARPGCNLYLTISEPIQQIVERELDRLVAEFAPKAAYAVMVNPATGAFMALAQRPSFNPNELDTIEAEQWLNRIAVAGFEPGSVMKPMTVSGAIDYGVVTLDSEFDCEGGRWLFCGKPLHDSGHHFDVLTVAEILEHSSNIGTAKIALAMGERRLYQTLLRYGFGEPTGTGFKNEACGIFRSIELWDGLSISRFPIGQGILVTPLQMVQAFAALANDGVMMQPYLVDRIQHPGGRIERTTAHPKRRVVRPHAARQVTQALKRVTENHGTAPKAAIPGYEVAGKTGTAQKVIDKRYSNQHYVATFVGYVPADDPAFVLLISADEPDTERGYYAGTVAAPTFRRIAERTLRYLDIAPRITPAPTVADTHPQHKP